MVRRMVHLLTISKADHSFQSVAKLLGIDERKVRRHMEGKKIKCFQKNQAESHLQDPAGKSEEMRYEFT
jgi:hypothetical protein